MSPIFTVAEVVGHLAFEGTLDESPGELVEESALREQVLRVVAVLEELVEQFFGDGHDGEAVRRRRSGRLHKVLDTPSIRGSHGSAHGPWAVPSTHDVAHG